jgi:hypothetical protein
MVLTSPMARSVRSMGIALGGGFGFAALQASEIDF